MSDAETIAERLWRAQQAVYLLRGGRAAEFEALVAAVQSLLDDGTITASVLPEGDKK